MYSYYCSGVWIQLSCSPLLFAANLDLPYFSHFPNFFLPAASRYLAVAICSVRTRHHHVLPAVRGIRLSRLYRTCSSHCVSACREWTRLRPRYATTTFCLALDRAVTAYVISTTLDRPIICFTDVLDVLRLEKSCTIG